MFTEADLWLLVLAFIATWVLIALVTIAADVWQSRRDFRRQLDAFDAGRQG